MDRESSLTDAPWSHVSLACDSRNSSWCLATLPYNPPPSHEWIHHSRYWLTTVRLRLMQRQAGLAPTLHRYGPMAWMRFELMILVLQARRSTNWAIKPHYLIQIQNFSMLKTGFRYFTLITWIIITFDEFYWSSFQRTFWFNDSQQSHYCNKNQAKRPSIYCLWNPAENYPLEEMHSAVLVQDLLNVSTMEGH